MLPSLPCRLWLYGILKHCFHPTTCFEHFEREEYFFVTTSRIDNHRLSPYLLVAFNTDRATCHHMEGARILEFSVAICQSWFLRVCLTHFVNCWAVFNKCSVRKIFATELYSGLVCYFSKSMLQDGEVLTFLSLPVPELRLGRWDYF